VAWQVQLLQTAAKDLKKLDRQVARRIGRRLGWLGANFDQIDPEPLKEDLAGFYKLRTGDYRAIYELLHEERIILVHEIGHRREIYRSR